MPSSSKKKAQTISSVDGAAGWAEHILQKFMSNGQIEYTKINGVKVAKNSSAYLYDRLNALFNDIQDSNKLDETQKKEAIAKVLRRVSSALYDTSTKRIIEYKTKEILNHPQLLALLAEQLNKVDEKTVNIKRPDGEGDNHIYISPNNWVKINYKLFYELRQMKNERGNVRPFNEALKIEAIASVEKEPNYLLKKIANHLKGAWFFTDCRNSQTVNAINKFKDLAKSYASLPVDESTQAVTETSEIQIIIQKLETKKEKLGTVSSWNMLKSGDISLLKSEALQKFIEIIKNPDTGFKKTASQKYDEIIALEHEKITQKIKGKDVEMTYADLINESRSHVRLWKKSTTSHDVLFELKVALQKEIKQEVAQKNRVDNLAASSDIGADLSRITEESEESEESERGSNLSIG